MRLIVRTQISGMMFLQYFVWGSWWVTLGAYLNATGFDHIIGAVYSTQGIAAIITPLLLGAIADRFVAAEKLMAVLHLCGAATLLYLATLAGPSAPVFLTVLLYMCFYMPTLPLSNTVAMNAMSDIERQFPGVRVMGTVGWIVAGLTIGLAPAIIGGGISVETTNMPILVAAGASTVLGLFSLTLPPTPPKARGKRPDLLSITGLDIITQERSWSFWIFIACSFLLVVPLSFYYAYTNTFLVETGASLSLLGITLTPVSLQTLGQISEVLFLLLLPFFFVRLGIKWVLFIGMVAWVARYLLFAFGISDLGPIMPVLLIGIALHGICYDFFFVAGQIYVDKRFGPEMRARAQAFLTLITLGIGQAVGSLVANAVYTANTISANDHDWQTIWLAPATLAAIVAITFVFAFKGNSPKG